MLSYALLVKKPEVTDAPIGEAKKKIKEKKVKKGKKKDSKKSATESPISNESPGAEKFSPSPDQSNIFFYYNTYLFFDLIRQLSRIALYSFICQDSLRFLVNIRLKTLKRAATSSYSIISNLLQLNLKVNS